MFLNVIDVLNFILGKSSPFCSYYSNIRMLQASILKQAVYISSIDTTSQARALYLRWAAAKTLVQAGHVTPPNLPKSGRFLISVLYAIKGGVAKYNMSLSCMSERHWKCRNVINKKTNLTWSDAR